MKQTIFAESSISLKAQAKWFGDLGVQRMLEVTDTVSAFYFPKMPPFRSRYHVYWVHQVDESTGFYYTGRVMTNLILGCPMFYPIRERELPVNETDGFEEVNVPEELLSKYIDMAENTANKLPDSIRLYPPEYTGNPVEAQYVFTRQTMRENAVQEMFGPEAIELGSKIDGMIDALPNRSSRDWYELMYAPYILEQFDRQGLVYEGFAYTNLIPGMPVFYPINPQTYYVNKMGGFKSVKLPHELQEQIDQIDYVGCLLEPNE